ncbi:shikimate dehydrogenase [candidate division KSB3 bacterium]|uniref:Shikimate dehydrogenase (NADP(+)) n=1 Tax=candidate division KSB3 bacterium TaxID=2044937 RepID=A0A2G6KIT0_9BACT|nr:MAG: shikimate dehydrogenase [candidate division KSB3 bacterium]
MLANAKTTLCGIIGKPVDHSMSPAIHNAAFEKLGLNYAYLAFNVDDVKGAIRGMRALHIRGLSVTMPHKREVMHYLDWIDPVAERIGAVNTVVNDNGCLKGYNTDWVGFVRSLEAQTPIQDKKIVILGAGGAARAIAFGLKEKGGNMTILNREQEIDMAKSLTGELDCAWGLLSQRDIVTDADIVVNATLLGMPPHDDKTAVENAWLRPEQVIYDVVYNPMETRLLREAKVRGCRVVPGYEMLLLQGVAQFEYWTGETAPVELMRTTLVERLTGKK